jgi:hypothetical protein
MITAKLDTICHSGRWLMLKYPGGQQSTYRFHPDFDAGWLPQMWGKRVTIETDKRGLLISCTVSEVFT